MRRYKFLGPLLLAAVLCFHTGCFRPYTIPDNSSGEDTVPTLGTVVTSHTTTDISTVADTSADTVGETVDNPTSISSGPSSQAPSTDADTEPSTSTVSSTAGKTTATTTVPPNSLPPSSPSEMKGVWLSYIELDAMFRGQTVSAAKAAIDQVMDNCKSYGLNTVFFHVRANSDAYYPSSLFKPAASVTGLIGEGFDPLAYAVASAHSRGLQLHAWVNPYRIGADFSYRVSGADYFAKTSGGVTRYYYVPTSANAQKLILDGLRELTANYAIDGIQYDDYFYPTGLMSVSVEDFEEADYAASGGNLSVADWRRAAVDNLVMGSYHVAHEAGVLFGISPSHDYDKTYSQMYADTHKWLAQPGYVDYVCPQVYFGFLHGSSPFNQVVDQWMSQPRADSVKLYIGLAIYKVAISDDTWAGSGRTEWANHDDIMKRSVEYLRSQNVPGMIFYSYTYFDYTNHWSSGNQADIARREVENLLPLLRD